MICMNYSYEHSVSLGVFMHIISTFIIRPFQRANVLSYECFTKHIAALNCQTYESGYKIYIIFTVKFCRTLAKLHEFKEITYRLSHQTQLYLLQIMTIILGYNKILLKASAIIQPPVKIVTTPTYQMIQIIHM